MTCLAEQGDRFAVSVPVARIVFYCGVFVAETGGYEILIVKIHAGYEYLLAQACLENEDN